MQGGYAFGILNYSTTPKYMDNLKFDVIFLKLVQRGSTIDGVMLPKVSEIIANIV